MRTRGNASLLSEGLSRLPLALRRSLYFTLYQAAGSRLEAVWKEFQSWETLDPAACDSKVEDKLGHLLSFACNHSEYYRELNLTRGSGEKATAWLKRFPVLDRETARECFSKIVNDDLRPRVSSPDIPSDSGYGLTIMKTGGTTGTPTSILFDRDARDWGWATWLYGLKQCGFPLGTPFIRLWGSEQDLLKQAASLKQRVLRGLRAEIALNAFRAREEDLKRYAAIMSAHPEAKHLMTYVDAAASLAMFIRDRHLPRPRFETLMACAGTLTAEYKKLFQEIFSAEVFDKYGSRECSDLACECRHHDGLHIFSPHVYLEIVDERGNDCPPGRQGKILVTMLNNRAFPMLRYNIGDIGEWGSHAACACGSPFPRIKSILGRQDDMLVTQDGTLQSSSFVRHFIGVALNRQMIREWQLEQTSASTFVFRFIPLKEDGLEKNLSELKKSFQLVFGTQIHFQTERVESIPPSASGKMRWIINSYRKAR